MSRTIIQQLADFTSQTTFESLPEIKPHEIESIKVYLEGHANEPIWLNRKIEHVQDAQFSVAHGVAVAAHLVPLGKAWQDPEGMFSRSVMDLMDRSTGRGTAIAPARQRSDATASAH